MASQTSVEVQTGYHPVLALLADAMELIAAARDEYALTYQNGQVSR